MYAEPLASTQVGQISWQCDLAGKYRLEVDFGGAMNAWNFYVEGKADFQEWRIEDSRGQAGVAGSESGTFLLRFGDLGDWSSKTVYVLDSHGTKPAPFWRESTFEFESVAPFANEWERLLGVSGDRVLDLATLAAFLPKTATIETMINRVDVRTYEEAPIMVKVTDGKGCAIVTTLRPQGGLGIQPFGLNRNAAGVALLRKLSEILS